VLDRVGRLGIQGSVSFFVISRLQRAFRQRVAGAGFALACVSAAAGLSTVGWSVPAEAQELAAAEALFNEGRRLMDAGEVERACKKFEESQRLDASAGTALNLASCYEKRGRTASAWAQYSVASRIAQAQGREMILQEADKKKAELEPRLSWIALELMDPVEGLAVFIGGTQLEAAASGSPIPVDPGNQRVEVRAPGYDEYSVEIVVNEGEATQTVVIPALVAVEVAPAPTTSGTPVGSEAPKDPLGEPLQRDKDHTWAYVVGGAGIVAFGASVGMGFAAKSKNDEAKDLCSGGTNECPPAALDRRDEAYRLANVATVVGSIGIAAMVTGVVLYILEESDDEAASDDRLRFAANVDATSAGLFISGGF